MDISLTEQEVRVLGCLMEKEMATPDTYPLSLNALLNACNQKSNRHPVVAYDEATVVEALDGLQALQLVRQSDVGRVTKYEQVFSAALTLVASEQAIICVLLLRGPQTMGEIRGRTERLHAFGNLEAVQETLTNLENMALVAKLPKLPGRKESRYAHLLDREAHDAPEAEIPAAEMAPGVDHPTDGPMADLQEQIDELRWDLHRLQQAFEAFKAQFD